MKKVLDPCCGSRMFWFDKHDSRAIFGDIRDDPVGLVFDDSYNLEHHAESVNKMFEEKREARMKAFGFHVQTVNPPV